jgi:hypothetical protein
MGSSVFASIAYFWESAQRKTTFLSAVSVTCFCGFGFCHLLNQRRDGITPKARRQPCAGPRMLPRTAPQADPAGSYRKSSAYQHQVPHQADSYFFRISSSGDALRCASTPRVLAQAHTRPEASTHAVVRPLPFPRARLTAGFRRELFR